MTTAPASAPFDIAEAMADAVSSILPAPEAVAPDEGEETLDAAAPEAEDAPDAPVADDEAASEADEAPADEAPDGEALPLPEGYVAVPSVTEGLATEFKLMDDEGEVEVPALIVEYKANGKVRQDRLDQVVKLAQWGVYNQEREQKLQSETQEKVAQYEQVLAEREAQMERLLNDEGFLEAVRDAYLAENSPEKRAERAEQRVEALRIEHQLETIRSSGEQFYGGEIEPALGMIAKALPTVSTDELESKLHMALQAHVEVAPNGVPFIPPSRYDAIRQYIVEDLALWAQAAHTRRAQPAAPSAEQVKAKAELERAQVEAQKAKRAMAQRLKPVGTAGKTADRPKVAAKPATVDDAVSSALNEVLLSLR